MNEDIFRIFISMRPWECAFFSPFRISPGCREPPLGCQEWPVWNRKVVLTRILSAVRTMTEAGTPRTSTISSLASKLRRGNQIQIPEPMTNLTLQTACQVQLTQASKQLNTIDWPSASPPPLFGMSVRALWLTASLLVSTHITYNVNTCAQLFPILSFTTYLLTLLMENGETRLMMK